MSRFFKVVLELCGVCAVSGPVLVLEADRFFSDPEVLKLQCVFLMFYILCQTFCFIWKMISVPSDRNSPLNHFKFHYLLFDEGKTLFDGNKPMIDE